DYRTLFHQEVSASIQMSQNAPSESHIFEQSAFNSRDSPSDGINQDFPLYSGQYFFDWGGRSVGWIGLERQPYQRIPRLPDAGRSNFLSCEFINEGVGQRSYHAAETFIIIFLLFGLLAQCFRVPGEPF